MKKQIKFINYVPSNEQKVITDTIEKMCKLGERHNIPTHILIKPIEVIYKSIEGYAMIQPLIDGHGGIASHRIYLNSNYIYSDDILERLVAHEVLHTFSYVDILKHNALKFKAIALDYEVRYNKRIAFLSDDDILYIEKTMKVGD